MSVTILDRDTRLRLKIAKVAQTLGDMADLVEDPTKRAHLKAKANALKTRAKEL